MIQLAVYAFLSIPLFYFLLASLFLMYEALSSNNLAEFVITASMLSVACWFLWLLYFDVKGLLNV